MPPYPKTAAKFSEAHFFLRQLETEIGQPDRGRALFCYYLSAFLAAGRSVTLFARLEASSHYEAIYAAWERDLDMADRMLWIRTNTIGMPFFDSMGTVGVHIIADYFDVKGRRQEVTTACRQYLYLVDQLITRLNAA
jgi:hypothetical protein